MNDFEKILTGGGMVFKKKGKDENAGEKKIKALVAEETTKSGIVLPGQAKQTIRQAACGPLCAAMMAQMSHSGAYITRKNMRAVR